MTLINLKNTPLKYNEKSLCLGRHDLEEWTTKHPTPFYLYDISTLKNNYQNFYHTMNEVLSTQGFICFAVKSNDHPRVLRELSALGSGADVVSIGELKKCLKAGFLPNKIVFSGVGKTDDEISSSLELTKGKLKSLNIESIDELQSVIKIATSRHVKINISLRFNPATPGNTHHHISTGGEGHKFGLIEEEVHTCLKLLREQPIVNCVGLSMHIGSQLTCMEQTIRAIKKLITIARQAETISTLNFGGGLGVHYDSYSDKVISVRDYMKTINATLVEILPPNIKEIIFEPGRFISATCGVLITKVIREKRNFRIVDAGMNDLIRPALYNAHHEIYPIDKPAHNTEKESLTIAGPICETGDFFIKNQLTFPVKKNDYLAITNAGAYGRVFASSYNSRDLIKEYFTDDN